MIRRILRWDSFYVNEGVDYPDDPNAIKTLVDYQETVDTVKGMSQDSDISEFLEDYILHNEDELAKLILGEDQYIYCEHAAEMVSLILMDASVPHQVIVGKVRGQSHAWVLLNDTIIDPTKSQFLGEVSPDEYTEGTETIFAR